MPIFTSEVAKQWLETSLSELKQEEAYLSTLDEYVGDGDHGQNVINGFRQIEAGWPEDAIDLKSIFHYAGSTLLEDKQSSGVQLYGEAFLEMAKTIDRNEITIKELGAAIEAAVKRMMEVGNTKRGDKTLIDVWAAVAGAVKRQTNPNVLVFEDAAKSALKTSKHLMAQKGQAAERGSKSVGFLDPGVVSSYYVFNALTIVLQEADASSIRS